jgi:hypothetical protein
VSLLTSSVESKGAFLLGIVVRRLQDRMSPVNVRGYKECVACGFVYCQFESTTDSARKVSEQTVNGLRVRGACSS